MLLKMKLYSGFVCDNPALPCYGLKKFDLELPKGSTIAQVHELLKLASPFELVSIVNGHAQSPEYVLNHDTEISVFLPMGDRQYDLFARLK